MPAVKTLADDYLGRAKVVLVDVDRYLFENNSLMKEFDVEAIPLLAVYKDGVEVGRVAGLDDGGKRRIVEILDSALAVDEAG